MIKRGLASLLILAAAFYVVHAQGTATLRGFVTDASDGQPLIGVNVTLVANDGTLFGIATDPDGFYTIAQVPAGSYGFRVSFVGYDTHEAEMTLAAQELARHAVRIGRHAQLRKESG